MCDSGLVSIQKAANDYICLFLHHENSNCGTNSSFSIETGCGFCYCFDCYCCWCIQNNIFIDIFPWHWTQKHHTDSTVFFFFWIRNSDLVPNIVHSRYNQCRVFLCIQISYFVRLFWSIPVKERFKFRRRTKEFNK